MSNRCENCKHVNKEFGHHICTIDDILVTESYCCGKWEDSHPAQAISGMIGNTSQQQIEELRAIADEFYRIIGIDGITQERLSHYWKTKDDFNALIRRYQKERASR